MTTYARENNPFWKGGRVVASNGYILIKAADNPGADVRGYVYEHRLVAEKMLGRLLLQGEIIHHRDGDKQNNSPENLEVVTGIKMHRFLHRKSKDKRTPGEDNPKIFCGCGCGEMFQKYDDINRPRRFISGHNMKARTNGKI